MGKVKNILMVLVVPAIFTQCRSSFENPNAADSADALNTPEGMVSLVVGIKHRFAVNSKFGNGAVFNGITVNGFCTREIKITSGANPDFVQLNAGGCTIVPNNNTITELWANYLLIIKQADDLLNNADKIKEVALNETIRKYASLYKAMAMGGLAMYWKEQPAEIGANAIFISRETALENAAALCDRAYALPSSIPGAYSATFGNEIDLQNALLVLAARFYLMLGNDDLAIARASLADASKKSVFIYNAQNANPLYQSAFTNSNGYTPQKTFGLPAVLQPDSTDQRIPFYLTPTGTTSAGFGFGKKGIDALPIYLPGEIWLIMAEAYARKGDLENARVFLDKVLTKTPAQDIFQVGAGLLPYNGTMDKQSLLNEIYKQRCIELFMSGMKLEDSRRFGRPGPKESNPERTIDFLPYPFQERNGNLNTPADPGC